MKVEADVRALFEGKNALPSSINGTENNPSEMSTSVQLDYCVYQTPRGCRQDEPIRPPVKDNGWLRRARKGRQLAPLGEVPEPRHYLPEPHARLLTVSHWRLDVAVHEHEQPRQVPLGMGQPTLLKMGR